LPDDLEPPYAGCYKGVVMNTAVESTNRRSKDYFHFGLTGLGIIVGVIGIVIISWRTVACGLVLVAAGLAYFGVKD
jgi:hypothetical protein